jgi:apolipoprotein D and lipocalin family protein
MNNTLIIITLFLLSGCLGMPQSVRPVSEFAVDRYLGKWYEIARLDHSFERGLTNVSAEYRLREDGGVSVSNRGFSTKEKQWQEAQGKAYFVNGTDQGYLKVSFFGPFYGSYVIFDVDKDNYQYAFVSGPNTSYLWLLSRTPEVAPEVMVRFIKRSQELDFDTNQLIFVEHNE